MIDPDSLHMQDRIRQIMDDSKLSQQDFASRLGISPASLSSIFNGRTRPTLNHSNAIHKAFPSINMSWLLYGEGNMYVVDDSESAVQEAQSENYVETSLFSNDQSGIDSSVVSSPSPTSQRTMRPKRYDLDYTTEASLLAKNIDIPKRKVKEIRVFFDDGTYESFVPQK